MEELQAYTPEEIVLSNLSELVTRANALHEQLRAHLRELAFEIAGGMQEGAGFLSVLPDYGADLERLFPAETAGTAKVLLCLELRRLLPDYGALWQDWFFPTQGEISLNAHNRIAYQRNGYTDRAFEIFSGVLRDARAAYPHSFQAACEEVTGGSCEYCILPLESSAEGRLRAFTALIEAYGLHIAATCAVSVGDGRSTRYALLRQSPAVLRSNEAAPRLLEIRCDLADRSPCDLLTGAERCGLQPLRTELDRARFSAVFAPGGDLPAFLLFLSMAYPHFEIVGLFRHLDERRK